MYIASSHAVPTQDFKTAVSKHLNLFDFKQFELEDNGLKLINKLMEFGVIQTNVKCIRGHDMTLVNDVSVLDKFKWKCRNSVKDPKKKF